MRYMGVFVLCLLVLLTACDSSSKETDLPSSFSITVTSTPTLSPPPPDLTVSSTDAVAGPGATETAIASAVSALFTQTAVAAADVAPHTAIPPAQTSTSALMPTVTSTAASITLPNEAQRAYERFQAEAAEAWRTLWGGDQEEFEQNARTIESAIIVSVQKATHPNNLLTRETFNEAWCVTLDRSIEIWPRAGFQWNLVITRQAAYWEIQDWLYSDEHFLEIGCTNWDYRERPLL